MTMITSRCFGQRYVALVTVGTQINSLSVHHLSSVLMLKEVYALGHSIASSGTTVDWTVLENGICAIS